MYADSLYPYVMGSGSVVLLPLVGALIGAVANGLYRDWQDKKARERERDGLLRIVDAELYENNRLLRGIKDSADIAKYPSQSHLSTDAWNQSRARLAESLSADQDHIFLLNRHFSLVVRIAATLEDQDIFKPSNRREKRNKPFMAAVGKAEGRNENQLFNLADRALSAGQEARYKGEKYIGPLPDYHAADEAQPTTG